MKDVSLWIPARTGLVLALLLSACGGSAKTGGGGPPDGNAAGDAGLAAAVTLPLEVLGPAQFTNQATFTVASVPSGGAKTLTLRVHGLTYQTEGSVQINGGAWIDLNNANPVVTVQGSAKGYGGIGGAFLTLPLSIALDGTELEAGKNTVTFRFNGTDGRSLGFRVLAFNFLDTSGTPILPSTTFAQEDPTTWTPPLPATSDNLTQGQMLWTTATLEDSPLHTNENMLSHCSDCHSVDGRDLKYFNYSNNSIIQRAIYHGLTEAQGQLIATFIRSNPSRAPGRVWNPPFQPGPGLDSVPLSDWSAGAGIDAVLEDDAAIQPTLPGAGMAPDAMAQSETSGMTLARYNMREAPLATQLMDWNHWLPLVGPADALGSVAAFQATDAYKLYQQIRTQLSSTAPAANTAYIETDLLNDSTSWSIGRVALENAITAVQGTGTEAAFVDNYNAAVWSAQKMWEIVQEFDLQGAGQQLYGLSGERASWFVTNRFIFDVSPHAISGASGAPDLTSFQIFGDPTLGNTCPVSASNPTGSCRVLANDYAASNWYEVQLELNPGFRRSAFPVHSVIDWGYMKNFENSGHDTGSAEVMRLARFTLKAMDELDTGLGPDNTSWGWNFRDEITQFLQSVGDLTMKGGWSTSPADSQVLATIFQLWLERSARFPLASWQSVQSTSYDGQNLPPANYVLGSGSYPAGGGKGDNLTRSFADQYVVQAPTLVTLGVPAAITNGFVAFGAALYPDNDWTPYEVARATSVAAPTHVVLTASGAEQLGVSWTASAGASSYNVKRSEGTNPFLTVAYRVDGTSWTDRDVVLGTSYRYIVSANAGNDESADSASSAAEVPQTGLVYRWALGSALAPGTLVPEIATTTPANSGQVMAIPDGGAYVSLAQGVQKQLGGTATVTAWVQLPKGTAAHGVTLSLPALVGATSRTNASFAYGILDNGGHVGVLASECDGTTTTSTPVYSTEPVNDGAWHFVAFTRASATGAVQVYVDGTLSVSGTSGKGLCENFARSLGRIDSSTTGQIWPGLMRDVRIYDDELSASAIAALKTAG